MSVRFGLGENSAMAATGRIAVVGGGILGLTVARELRIRHPDATVIVLEKEAALAQHQTGHNSGVAHAGLYYPPGSLKARLCRRGLGLLKNYCRERDLPYDERGKLVVARDPVEVDRLRDIQARATANGVEGLAWLGPSQLHDLEPNVTGAAALHSPYTAIVDFPAVCRAIAAELTAAGGQVELGFEVRSIRRRGAVIELDGHDRDVVVDVLVACAGLHADRIARLAGDTREPRIVPFRGEYFRLVEGRQRLVHKLIYPVPDPRYPFLGVHFTPRVDGSVDIGPNAVLATAREGYQRRDVSARDLLDALAWRGFGRFAREHWRTGLREVRGSLSKRAFIAEAASFVPALRPADVVPAPAGVRAQAVDPDGSLVEDFRITERERMVLVRNAPSPGATSSFAIAEVVAERVDAVLDAAIR
jgi:L-2-hydroxyglutarate oxidase LhgO